MVVLDGSADVAMLAANVPVLPLSVLGWEVDRKHGHWSRQPIMS